MPTLAVNFHSNPEHFEMSEETMAGSSLMNRLLRHESGVEQVAKLRLSHAPGSSLQSEKIQCD